jgi:hypothetical protein
MLVIYQKQLLVYVSSTPDDLKGDEFWMCIFRNTVGIEIVDFNVICQQGTNFHKFHIEIVVIVRMMVHIKCFIFWSLLTKMW